MELEHERTRICPTCRQVARVRRFDVMVRQPCGPDREHLGVLAMCCRLCGRFILDPGMADALGIRDRDVSGAIQSDLDMRPVGRAVLD